MRSARGGPVRLRQKGHVFLKSDDDRRQHALRSIRHADARDVRQGHRQDIGPIRGHKQSSARITTQLKIPSLN